MFRLLVFHSTSAAIGAFSFAEQNINRSTCLQRGCLLSHEVSSSGSFLSLQENGALYMLLSNIKRPRFPEQVKPAKRTLTFALPDALPWPP
jgi:hypothetical protein